MIRKKINDVIKSNFNFIKKNSGNTETYIVDDTCMLIVMYNKNNVFKINRDFFEKIEEELLSYAFLLVEENRKNLYFVKYKEPNNALRNSFESTKKNELYFGKEILQKKIEIEELKEKIEELKNNG